MTKQELFKKAEHYKSLINSNRPVSLDQLTELDNYFRINFTFCSNAIEENNLTLEETKSLLEADITVGGKSIRECYETTGHAEAYDYMLFMARTEQLEITEAIMKRLHYFIYYRIDEEEAGQYRKSQTNISSTENKLYPSPEDIPHLMEHFIGQMQTSKRFMHPIEFAALCHKRLVDIQPFKEGNGRVARLLMNLILLNAGYGVTVIPPELGNEYKNALTLSKGIINPNIDAFIDFIAERVIESERDYCRLLKIE